MFLEQAEDRHMPEHSDGTAGRHIKSLARPDRQKTGENPPSLCVVNTTPGFDTQKQVIRPVIVGVIPNKSVSSGCEPTRLSDLSGDDSVTSGMPYRRKQIGVRICKQLVLRGSQGAAFFEREEAL